MPITFEMHGWPAAIVLVVVVYLCCLGFETAVRDAVRFVKWLRS